MSRLSDTPALADEIAKPVLRPFMALHIDLDDPVHAFTGKGEINLNGSSYVGIEGVAALDAAQESTDGSASGVSATLFKVPSEMRDDVARQAQRGRLYELFVGALDETFRNVIGWKRIWRGSLQGYEITDAGDSLTVKASGETRAIDQRKPAIKRFTNEFQQRKHPGDRFFEYLPRMAEVQILWAKAKQDATSGDTAVAGALTSAVRSRA